MNIRTYAAAALLVATSALAASPPQPDDYAQGIAIATASSQPLIETTLPDSVYQTVRRADLGDLRVFNANGLPVPYAVCSAPQATAPAIRERSLPVFELQEGSRSGTRGAQIEVRTANGTQVNVREGHADDANTNANAGTHIIDARGAREPLRAIQFDWTSPDGASEVKVRIAASEDLDRWAVIVPAGTLLSARRSGRGPGAQKLRRERIELPQQRYDYLRVERADGGPPLVINAVTAELVPAATEIEPRWFMANHAGSCGRHGSCGQQGSGEQRGSGEPGMSLFDTARLAPVSYARLRLPRENSSVRVVLQSRGDDESSWQERWRGETYVIVAGTERRVSPPAQFDATTDRHWRVQVLADAQINQPITLELGYRPARLRFLAQGPSPYTLAFGSRRAEIAAPTACDALLADVSAEDRARLIGKGQAGALRVLGGEGAFEPLPKKTPLRLVVLWSVLIAGVVVLVGMALSLLKRVR